MLAAYSTPSISQKITKERLKEYLINREKLNCTLIINHSKVAQKSYGNEKRFFCPPPCVYLSGEGWKKKEAKIHEELQKEVAHKIRRGELPENALELINVQFCAFIGIGKPTEQEKQPLEFQPLDHDENTRCAVKTLYISDTDKRKYFNLNVNCFYDLGHGKLGGHDLGMFDSKRIKVISKPSKKKQSMKSSDNKNLGICIAGGTKIALFSRVRSQTTNTRYLLVEDDKFIANHKRWGVFTIHLIENESEADPNSDHYHVRDGFINYGSVVKLVDSTSQLALPNMRILKVDKHHVNVKNNADEPVTNADEPVSQLHKCAFQMLDNEQNFLCFNNENIVAQQALTHEKGNGGKETTIIDGAQWTIISTETTRYSFYEAMGTVNSQVTPIPNVLALNMEASETHIAYLELTGYNFVYPSLRVWLGATELETCVLSPDRIRCQLPLPECLASDNDLTVNGHHSTNEYSSDLRKRSDRDNSEVDKTEFPVSLVRDDGVIYATELTVKYLRNGGKGPLSCEDD